jgi:hypothetical protein
MFNKFCQDSEIINSLKAKKGINPILAMGVCPVRSLANGELSFTIGVYYNNELDENLTMLLSLWLDYSKPLLSQAEYIVRLTGGNGKQSKVGILISTFIIP